MKSLPAFVSIFLCLFTASALAGTVQTSTTESSAATEVSEDEPTGLPFEFDAQFSYIGDSDVERDGDDDDDDDIDDFDETHTYMRLIYTPRIFIGILRLGAAWERFKFDFPRFAGLPEELQSFSAVVGLDTKFSDSILIRLEAQPGWYGTEHDMFDEDNFNVPFIVGGTYIYNSSLQFVFGVSVNFDRDWPVLPGGGIRWKMAPQWVLNAVLPTPRLEYELNKSFTLYAGGDLKGTTVRTHHSFGNSIMDPSLNNELLSYTEVRTGGGVEWKITPGVALTAEAGYVPYRNFDFHDEGVEWEHENGAPYGMLSFKAEL